ncbi:putative C2H2 finger domain protein [Aspergillus fumigatus Af293]|jgi:bud site selection protein 20|uniref:C2H2 finger domain protein, putative n=2 Tax=Aspergillus fumigatus TaxID=746128 RepID=Q4WLN2_ASPFU|nr:C2H2 finger domain protein, putative [Aspergillus fumigatus Af293]EAL89132.1 C2H2 finger domain protein, putative [Aspergillus fumigatus Af293]EDP55487.1 C2H2 finger domain protein, putative [Aspergillus fumigatus A1163]
MGAVRKIKTKRRTRYDIQECTHRAIGALEGPIALTLLVSCRDYDQVRADIDSPKHLTQYKATKDAEDLPGLGKHYCVECSKWFESEYNLVAHTKGKNHKRRSVIMDSANVFLDRSRLTQGCLNRLRLLREEPHSQKIAEAAVGLSTDNGLRQQETVVDMED